MNHDERTEGLLAFHRMRPDSVVGAVQPPRSGVELSTDEEAAPPTMRMAPLLDEPGDEPK